MNDQSRPKLDSYFAEAASWNHDRIEANRRSTRNAWTVAGAAAVIALLEALALVLLMPLKTVEPYTLMVDRTTGYVQALKPLDQAKIAPDVALTQSFLVQYVTAREGFDIATVNADYRKVALLSTGPVRSAYVQQMQGSNPESPLNLYPRTTIVSTAVKSVSPLGSNAALVRFDTLRADAGAEPRIIGSWAAVVKYRYSDAPMKLEDRFINPLGFQVVSYRKTPETLPTAATAPPPDTSYYPPSGAPPSPEANAR